MRSRRHINERAYRHNQQLIYKWHACPGSYKNERVERGGGGREEEGGGRRRGEAGRLLAKIIDKRSWNPKKLPTSIDETIWKSTKLFTIIDEGGEYLLNVLVTLLIVFDR
jgi:hypothetical protein